MTQIDESFSRCSKLIHFHLHFPSSKRKKVKKKTEKKRKTRSWEKFRRNNPRRILLANNSLSVLLIFRHFSCLRRISFIKKIIILRALKKCFQLHEDFNYFSGKLLLIVAAVTSKWTLLITTSVIKQLADWSIKRKLSCCILGVPRSCLRWRPRKRY